MTKMQEQAKKQEKQNETLFEKASKQESEREHLIRTGVMNPFGRNVATTGFVRQSRNSQAAMAAQQFVDSVMTSPAASSSSSSSSSSVQPSKKAKASSKLKQPKKKDNGKKKRKQRPENEQEEKWLKMIDEEDEEDQSGDDDENDDSDSEPVTKRQRLVDDENDVVDDGNIATYKERIRQYQEARAELANVNNDDVIISDHFKLPAEIFDKLFEYQKTCLTWLWELHKQSAGGILGDEMGLGKTVQISTFLAALQYSGHFKPSVIVCPGTVMKQWVRELHEWWPLFRVAIFHSSGSGNDESLIKSIAKDPLGILVTTYESVRINQDLLVKQDRKSVV